MFNHLNWSLGFKFQWSVTRQRQDTWSQINSKQTSSSKPAVSKAASSTRLTTTRTTPTNRMQTSTGLELGWTSIGVDTVYTPCCDFIQAQDTPIYESLRLFLKLLLDLILSQNINGDSVQWPWLLNRGNGSSFKSKFWLGGNQMPRCKKWKLGFELILRTTGILLRSKHSTIFWGEPWTSTEKLVQWRGDREVVGMKFPFQK